jgi:hypothetical protein
VLFLQLRHGECCLIMSKNIYSQNNRNAPYVLGMRSILFPLAAGNTVVFKG